MFTLGILTSSDMGAKGEREDTSGQTIREMLAPLGFSVTRYEIVPDEAEVISARLKEWGRQWRGRPARHDGRDRPGPTGCNAGGDPGRHPASGPRHPGGDASGRLGPYSYGNAESGHRRHPRQLPHHNLPGSPRAVRENLEAVIGAIPHALETLKMARVERHPTQ